jgi:hypothetical protein
MIFAMQAGILCAQKTEYSDLGFTLAISILYRGGMPPNTHTLEVKLTNTSFVERRETITACNSLWQYNITVVRDGILLEEKDAIQKIRKQGELERCRGYGGFKFLRQIKPGEASIDELPVTDFYDMSRPGTYEISVTEETDPHHPDGSFTVRSNTITIVVPKPEVAHD